MIARRRRYFHGRALKSRQGYVCTDSAKVHVPYWELDALIGTKLREDRLVGRTAGCPAAVWHPVNGRPWSSPCWGRFIDRNRFGARDILRRAVWHCTHTRLRLTRPQPATGRGR